MTSDEYRGISKVVNLPKLKQFQDVILGIKTEKLQRVDVVNM